MDKSVDYHISSIQGQQLQDGTWNENHPETVQLELDNIQDGMYIITMRPKFAKTVSVKFFVSNAYEE